MKCEFQLFNPMSLSQLLTELNLSLIESVYIKLPFLRINSLQVFPIFYVFTEINVKDKIALTI